MNIYKKLFCHFLILTLVPLSKATTTVKFEPNGGNITISRDRYTDIEYKDVSIESIIGQFHQNLKTDTWEHCVDCEIWYVNDTRRTDGPIYKTMELERSIPINRSILENFATHNIDKDFAISRQLVYPARNQKIAVYERCYHIENRNGNSKVYDNKWRDETGRPFCLADLGAYMIIAIIM